MKIGILSDTHGRTEPMKQAVELLLSKGAEFFIHCGDVGSPEVLDHLAGLKGAFVFGNTDFDRAPISTHAAFLGIRCLNNGGEIELDGIKLAVTHGDDPNRVRAILNAQEVRYLFVGHTHLVSDTRVGQVRIINPGALHRTARRSVALLDTKVDLLDIFYVDG